MKIATWNVNSINVRSQRLLAFLGREQPDAVCLQELKGEEAKFPWDAVRAAGYEAAVWGQKTYNGVALLAKSAPQDVRRGFGDGGDDSQARCLSGVVNGVRVYSLYVPNGQDVGTEKYAFKLEWLRRLRAMLDRDHRTDDKIVLGGDFNVAPEDRDVHDPDLWRGKILCSDPERAGFKTVCEWGLADTFRLYVAEPGNFSWWDYRNLSFPKNQGLRIDFLLASQTMREICRSVRIDRNERKGQQPSDHAPVIAEFAI